MRNSDQLISSAMKVNEHFRDSKIKFLIKYGSYTYNCQNDDSDYDIRGICLQASEAYLDFIPQKDLVESKVSDDIDVVLFDVDKTFQLLSKYNPMLYEWIFSDQILINDLPEFDEFKESIKKYYDVQPLYMHYNRMALADLKLLTENKRNYIKGSINVMRELVCANLCAQNILPPVRIDELTSVSNLDKKYLNLLSHLVQSKKDNTGMCDYTNNQILELATELNRINESIFNKREKLDNSDWIKYLRGYLIKLKQSN